MSGGGDKTEVFLHNQVDKSTKVGWADAGGSKWNVRTDGMLEPLHHLTEGVVVRVFGWENNQPKMVNLGASSALTFDVNYTAPPPPPPPPSPPPPPPHDDDDDDVDVGAIVGITIALGMRVMDMGPNTALSLSLSVSLFLSFSLFRFFSRVFSLFLSLSFSWSLSW